MSTWRPNQQAKPWPWPNAIYLDDQNEDSPHVWGNAYGRKYDNPKGQVLEGTVYKNVFPVPGEHYLFKSKKSFKDKYSKNKARFEKKTKLPPITEAMSEVSSKGSTRSRQSWVIPRYNPDIISNVMDQDDSDDEEDIITGSGERKYRKSGRQSSLRHVDIIRNVQTTKAASEPHPTKISQTNTQVNPLLNNGSVSKDTNIQSVNGLHRTEMNGDAVLANQMMMNNGSIYQEQHPLGVSGIGSPDEETSTDNQNWTDNTLEKQKDSHSTRTSSFSHRSIRNTSKKNCLLTSFIIVVIVCVIGAGVAAYMLLRDSGDDEPLPTPTPSIETRKYEVLLILQDGNFSINLNNDQHSDYIELSEEICQFLMQIPMRNYLDIFNCEVISFRNGSILSDVDIYIREHDVAALRASNSTLTQADILQFIQDDINNEINNITSAVTRSFINKYSPVVTDRMVPPTTEGSTTISPSMTEVPSSIATSSHFTEISTTMSSSFDETDTMSLTTSHSKISPTTTVGEMIPSSSENMVVVTSSQMESRSVQGESSSLTIYSMHEAVMTTTV